MIPSSKKMLARAAFAFGILLAGAALAQPAPAPIQAHKVVVTTVGTGNETADPSGAVSTGANVIRIESVEPDAANEPAQKVTWLGVSTEEVSDVLAAQLGLKSGQGLVVMFVAPDSPAAKAGIQKYDVIEELGDQMLVDAAQLRKLVQMQKDGDTVQLTLHRAGKKQTVAATLTQRAENLSWSAGSSLTGGWPALARAGTKNDEWVLENQKASMAFAGIDKQRVNAEVQRSMEEARKAIQEAMRQSDRARRELPTAPIPPIPPVPPQMPVAPEAVTVGDDATVTVTQDGVAVKTIVKSDDTGILILVASPKKHLTVHDPDGKLLFDGEIESAEQQQKVPAKLWEKVKPLLPKLKPADRGETAPHAQSEGGQKIEIRPRTGVLVNLRSELNETI